MALAPKSFNMSLGNTGNKHGALLGNWQEDLKWAEGTDRNMKGNKGHPELISVEKTFDPDRHQESVVKVGKRSSVGKRQQAIEEELWLKAKESVDMEPPVVVDRRKEAPKPNIIGKPSGKKVFGQKGTHMAIFNDGDPEFTTTTKAAFNGGPEDPLDYFRASHEKEQEELEANGKPYWLDETITVYTHSGVEATGTTKSGSKMFGKKCTVSKPLEECWDHFEKQI